MARLHKYHWILHYYIDLDEYVKFQDSNNTTVIKLARDAITENKSDVYMYHPYALPGSPSDGIISSGYIEGKVGYVDNNNYRYQVFMRNIGVYICIGIVAFIFVFMFYLWYKNKEKGDGSNTPPDTPASNTPDTPASDTPTA